MKFVLVFKLLLPVIVTTIIMLVVASLLDIVLVFFYPRFYSQALFITTFGVAGVFTTVLSYMQSIERATVKNETTRWLIIATIIVISLLLYFVFAVLEGGEYKAPFRAFAITMALTTLLFMKGNIE